MPLIEQLSLQDARLVALCGAGGKTSLLYALGREWADRGEKVVLTTSTHIQSQLPPGCALWDRADEEKLLSLWAAGTLPMAGRPAGRKLQGPSEEMWALLRRWWCRERGGGFVWDVGFGRVFSGRRVG